MGNIRVPMAVCAAVAEILNNSHAALDAAFLAAGAPGPPPELPHHSKWKIWLSRATNDPAIDGLRVVGNLIEEFMDLPPAGVTAASREALSVWKRQRERLDQVFEENGFQYFRGGRVLPKGEMPPQQPSSTSGSQRHDEVQKPASVEALIETLVRGLPRAMHPLTHRRAGATPLSFEIEADIQDLLHSQLRPWIADIRAEEFTPSYAGSSTRMDFLLTSHKLVIEVKRVRDRGHGSRVGNELIIDVEHYRKHPDCERLWCVIYDPARQLQNPAGLIADLEGQRTMPGGNVQVRVFVVN